MVHALLVIVFVAVMVGGRGWWDVDGAVAWGIVCGALGGLWLATQLAMLRLGRLLDSTGSGRNIVWAERVLAASRVVAVAIHLAGVLALGTLEAVRERAGDLVAVDEVLTCLPALAFIAAGWWSIYPIERRVREAVLLRQLDEGRSVQRPVSRGAFVMWAARHQMALIVLPVVLILAWGEGAEWLSRYYRWPRGFVEVAGGRVRLRELMQPVAQVAGVVVVFTLLPLLLRHVWDTVRLGEGQTRDGLLSLCRAHGVRVRDLLVWRTGGSMLNGAVMGLVGPARYILLTDALLELMTPGQVEAVTAHEVGHVRRRHMPWLAAAALAAVFGAAMVAEWGTGYLPEEWRRAAWVEGGGVVVSLAAGLLIFGFASRRFEWQADAFAVQHLSGSRRGSHAVAITAESVAHMSGALQAVADLNHVPAGRWSWRHGSIESRQRKLAALVGQRGDRLWVDTEAGLVKMMSALVLAVVIGIATRQMGVW